MVGVTLPSIDRALAEIDRALAPPFRLPVGGPVADAGRWCWKDSLVTGAWMGGVFTFLSACDHLSGDNGLDLCDAHYDSWVLGFGVEAAA